MKKNRDIESSLELLLDTMCNTFGGVMFIAIALVVVLSLASSIKDLEDSTSPAIAQQYLEDLQKELDALKSSYAIRTELLKTLKNDPRRELLQEIVLLETRIRDLELEQSKKISTITRLTQNNQKLQQEQKHLQSELLKMEQQKLQEIAKLEKQKKQINQMLEELKKIVSNHITFKMLTVSSKKQPYHLIVYENRIWRVGPDELGEDPHSDVDFYKSKGKIICTIKKSEPGIPLLQNGKFSEEAERLLEALPANRYPEFSLHSNSTADFFIFREELKKGNITHGINTLFESAQERFIYIYTKEAVKHDIYQ